MCLFRLDRRYMSRSATDRYRRYSPWYEMRMKGKGKGNRWELCSVI